MKKIMLAMSLCVGAAKLHTAEHDVTPQEAMILISTMQLVLPCFKEKHEDIQAVPFLKEKFNKRVSNAETLFFAQKDAEPTLAVLHAIVSKHPLDNAMQRLIAITAEVKKLVPNNPDLAVRMSKLSKIVTELQTNFLQEDHIVLVTE